MDRAVTVSPGKLAIFTRPITKFGLGWGWVAGMGGGVWGWGWGRRLESLHPCVRHLVNCSAFRLAS